MTARQSVTTSREILAGVLDGARAGGWPALEAAAEVELGLLSVTASTGSSDELRSARPRHRRGR